MTILHFWTDYVGRTCLKLHQPCPLDISKTSSALTMSFRHNPSLQTLFLFCVVRLKREVLFLHSQQCFYQRNRSSDLPSNYHLNKQDGMARPFGQIFHQGYAQLGFITWRLQFLESNEELTNIHTNKQHIFYILYIVCTVMLVYHCKSCLLCH